MPLSTIEEAIADLRAGKFVIIVDAPERESEGDLVIAAQFATPQAINFMAREARGLICLSLTGQRLDALHIPMMVDAAENSSRYSTAFTVSVEARCGVTTGISAYDRATTIRVMIDPSSGPEDIARPGHVFPLRAAEGGVLARPGHTEASLDLVRMAGLYPAAVICEIMDHDGTMAQLPALETFAARHGLRIISIDDLIAYRYRTESIAHRRAEANLPTPFGDFRLLAYEDSISGEHHLALVLGDLEATVPIVRLHSECLTGDAFSSLRCDCGAQLLEAQQRIAAAGSGVVVYLRQEGRGIGLLNKLRAYALQDQGLDTVEANHQLGFPADLRHYGVAAQILHDLGLTRVRLLTNNPHKLEGLMQCGIEVIERLPLVIPPTPNNRRYLVAKRDKLGHLLPFAERKARLPNGQCL